MASRTRRFLIPDPEQRVAPRPFVGGLRQNPKAPPAAKYRRPEEPFGGGTTEGSLRASEVKYDCSPAAHIGLLRTGNGCPTRINKATVQLNQIEITSNCPGDKRRAITANANGLRFTCNRQRVPALPGGCPSRPQSAPPCVDVIEVAEDIHVPWRTVM
jgi:hypothetical protein